MKKKFLCLMMIGAATLSPCLFAAGIEMSPQDSLEFTKLLSTLATQDGQGLIPVANGAGSLEYRIADISCTVVSIPMIHRHSQHCSLVDGPTQKKFSFWKYAQVQEIMAILRHQGVPQVPLYPIRIGDYSFKMSVSSIQCEQSGDRHFNAKCLNSL